MFRFIFVQTMNLKIKHKTGQFQKVFFLIFVMFFVENHLFAFNYTPVEIAKILNRANAETNKFTHSAISETDYIISGDSILLNPDGTHYLYSYLPSRNTIIRLDHSLFHGHNFVRHLFIYKDELYAFGGYGFWNDHAKLIRFDKHTREWELVMIKNDVHLIGRPMMSVLQGDSIYMYGTIQHHVNPKGISMSSNCYLLNLNKLEISEFKSAQPNVEIQQSSSGYNNQFSKYVIFGTPNSILYIFDKAKNKMYKNASGPALWDELNTLKVDCVDSIFRVLVGNELISVCPDLSLEKINIDNYIELYCFEESNFNDWTPVDSKFELTDFLYKYIILVLLILVIFLGYHFLSTGGIYNRKTLNQYRILEEDINVFSYLDKFKNNSYTEHEIDIVFRIFHLPRQVRKIKRSQIINELNQKQSGKIEKIVNANKHNEFIYKIND